MKKKLCLLLSILMMLSLLTPVPKTYAAGNLIDLSTEEYVDEVKVYTLTTGDDCEADKINTYAVSVSPEDKEAVFPVTFTQKGLFICSYEYIDTNPSTSYGDFEIYSDEECTQEIRYSSYNGYAAIPSKGTYYLKFSVSDYGDEVPEDGYLFSFACQYIGSGDRALKDKTWSAVSVASSSDEILFKVTAAKAGTITLGIEADSSVYVTLLNSSKKEISEEAYYSSNNGKVSFAVAKGTYYIKARTYTDYFRIKYTFKAITETSSTTKAKAKALTKGKLYSGLVTATDKNGTVDWYKITLTKSQPVKITFKGSVSSGQVSLEFFGNGIGGSITQSIRSEDADRSFTAETYTSKKLPKGTYYIKVTKSTPKTSGSYYLRFDK